MVQGVGGVGDYYSGSFKNLKEYQVYYPMYQDYVNENKSSLSFESWLIMRGYITNFTQRLENYIETGNNNVGDGKDGNTLNANAHLSNAHGAIYQSQDDDCFYEFDFDTAQYKKLVNNDEVTKAIGLSSSVNKDTIKFGYNSAVITDYTFGNLDDGQDTKVGSVFGRYAGVTYVQQEFDLHYILNALMIDPTDPQYQIAKKCFDDLCANLNQWMSAADQAELNEIEAQYGCESPEYKAKLQSLMLKNLDQANEWIEEHSHVANVNAATLGELESVTGVNGANGVDGVSGGNGTDSSNISYRRTTVLNNAGLLTAYSTGEHYQGTVFNNSKTRDVDAKNEALAYIETQLNNIIAQLKAELGDQLTPEIEEYMYQAKSIAAASDCYEIEKWKPACKNKCRRANVDIKKVCDTFFNEFDSLCRNNGKTSDQVAADNKAAAEKKEQETSGYQSLYNMNIKSTASSAGVNKNIQVTNVNTAAEVRTKAENEILTPLKNKIKNNMAGKGISDADLQTLLDNCGTAALSDCTAWATTSDNSIYTIDADALIERFSNNVKEAIKGRGYDF